MSSDDAAPTDGACGCCESASIDHAALYNRPGLSALAYRVATHSGFLQRMVAGLARQQVERVGDGSPLRPLARLSTRDATDPAVALLDAWAMSCDVLAFYQERIANEGFLRTATERRSVLELARSIGYELNPGVAASTVLAFTVDGSKDSPPEVTLAAGTRVLSLPAKDQLPQPFETTEAIVARTEWNALKPHVPMVEVPNRIERGVTELRLKGTTTGLRPGDAVLIVGGERLAQGGDEHWDFRIIEQVETLPDKGCTRIRFAPGLGDQKPTDVGPAALNPRLYALRQRASIFGHNAPEWDRLDPAIKAREAPAVLGAITAVAFAPDGATAACTVADGTVRLWTVGTAKPLASASGHAGAAHAVAYTPDGQYLVTGGDDGCVRVWDARSGAAIHAFVAFSDDKGAHGHRGAVLGVACGSYTTQYWVDVGDDKREIRQRSTLIAVSVGADAQLLAWDLSTLPPADALAAPIKAFGGHHGAINGVALHASGTLGADGETDRLTLHAATAGDDGRVRVIDVITGVAQELEPHAAAAEAVALSSDGLRLASGGADGLLQSWTRRADGSWSRASANVAKPGDALIALCWSADGTRLLAGRASGTVQLGPVSAVAPSESKGTHQGPVLAVAWSPTQPYRLLTGGADARLLLRNTALTVEHTLASPDPQTLGEWPGFALSPRTAGEPTLDLDTLYPALVPGGWIVLARKGYAEAYNIRAAELRWISAFMVSSKVTRLTLDSAEHMGWFGRRSTTVHAQSEELPWFVESVPDRSPLQGKAIELASFVTGLAPGRAIVASGHRMKARIDDLGGSGDAAVRLVSEDGYSSVDLALADLLECLAPPLPLYFQPGTDSDWATWVDTGDGFVRSLAGKPTDSPAHAPQLRWLLRDRNGFEGLASVPLLLQPDGRWTCTAITAQRPTDRSDAARVSEVGVLQRIVDLRTRSRFELEAELQNLFDAETFSINANVAQATHGETVASEVLGSGDGTRTNQRFRLRKPSMTFVSAPTATGGQSTLQVRVNDVLWTQATSLQDLGPRDQSYVVQHDNDQFATVIFGDGEHGARLPTGQENVVAGYRVGLGPDGEVAAGVVKLLQTKPLGVREAINPIAATGAAAPQSLDDARTQAPRAVLMLDRVVSLRDHEDFAAGFSGVGKAQATTLWTGHNPILHLSVATASGDPLSAGSALAANLGRALAELRDPVVPVRIEGYALLHFKLQAELRFDSRHLPDRVAAGVRATLADAFSFARRSFGQSVSGSELVQAMQAVEGVVAVNIQVLAFTDASGHAQPEGQVSGLGTLPARRATWDSASGSARPAQLLLLFPVPQTGVELTLLAVDA